MTDNSPRDKDNLPKDVQRQLVRCEGFLDLKMADRAEQELQEIDEIHHSHFYYRWLMINLMTLREQWSEALPLVKEMREEQPKEPGFWIQEAYITRRAYTSIERARSILEAALEQFPNEALIHYNLGCYACQLGNNEEAKQRLKEAIDLEERWLSAALKDEDLEPIHDELEEWACT